MNVQQDTTARGEEGFYLAQLNDGFVDKKSILFVEDAPFVREVTADILRLNGYDVMVAKNADEAVRMYDGCCGEVDLLLTDIVLPGESGRALAKNLRKRNPRLKVLLVSGYPDQVIAQETRDECIAKPFNAATLLNRIGQLISLEEFWGEGRAVAMHACGSV